MEATNLGFGRVFTEHMVAAQWTPGGGWSPLEVEKRRPLELDPSTTVFHYGQSVFEGLKAYKQPDGSVGVFRPDTNAASLVAQQQAAAEGCEQVLFLDAIERRWLEELGGMNVMLVGSDGTLITPPLSGTILEGVTRDSLLTLARDRGRRVEERPVSF